MSDCLTVVTVGYDEDRYAKLGSSLEYMASEFDHHVRTTRHV